MKIYSINKKIGKKNLIYINPDKIKSDWQFIIDTLILLIQQAGLEPLTSEERIELKNLYYSSNNPFITEFSNLDIEIPKMINYLSNKRRQSKNKYTFFYYGKKSIWIE